MFGISMEHLLVLGAILLLFGPRRLPELGQGLGKAIKNFRDAFTGVEEAKYKQLNAEKEAAAQQNSVVQTEKKKEPEQPS